MANLLTRLESLSSQVENDFVILYGSRYLENKSWEELEVNFRLPEMVRLNLKWNRDFYHSHIVDLFLMFSSFLSQIKNFSRSLFLQRYNFSFILSLTFNLKTLQFLREKHSWMQETLQHEFCCIVGLWYFDFSSRGTQLWDDPLGSRHVECGSTPVHIVSLLKK